MNYIKYHLAIIFFFFGIYCGSELFSQNNNNFIDSLHTQLKEVSNDGSRYKILMDLSNNLFLTEPNQCSAYLIEAIEIAEKLDSVTWKADARNRLGSCYFILGKYNDALDEYFLSLQLSEDEKYWQGSARASGNIGLVFNKIGEYNKALEYHLKSLEIEESLDSKEGIASSLNNIGNIYYSLKNLDEALKYFQRSLKLYQSLGNDDKVSHSFNNIGIIYHEKGKYDKALLYMQSALVIFIESGNRVGEATTYNNLGRVYSSINKYSRAIDNFEKAYNIYYNSGNKWGMANNLLNSGNVNLQEEKYKEAKKNFDKAIVLTLEINAIALLSEIYKSYSDVFLAKNDFKNALHYYKKYSDLSDTIYNKETAEKISDLQKSYEITKKEKENKILSMDNEISKLKLSKSRRNQYLIGFTLLLVIILIIFIYYRYRENKKKNILLKNKSLEVESAYEKLKDFNEKLENKVKERTKELQEEIDIREKTDIDLKKALKTAKDANYLKNAFLANMSHEIRTPLNGIIGYSSLLETELSLMENEELYEYATGIQQSGDRLMHLLNNIIDIARVEANDMEVELNPCFINEIVENVCEIYRFNANDKKLKFNSKLNELPKAYADSSSLTKILSDIIDNAIKYTDKGFINVSTAVDSKNKQIVVSIKDTGIGIDKAYLDHIFEAFRQESSGYSRNYQGAGLGLPLAEKIIKLMGGDIQIDSVKGKGTTVKLFIKIFDDSDKKTVTKSKKKIKIPKTKDEKSDSLDIFFVEDDRMNRLVLNKMLSKVGNCTAAVDGDETINIINESFNKGKTFDIMIFDINLPAPWDGIKLMKEIKKRWKKYKDIPFIALTAYAMSGDKERFLENGFDNYMPKPVNKGRLINMINNQILLRKK